MKFNNKFRSRFKLLKGGKVALVISSISLGSTLSFSAPSGGVVTSGTANIVQSGHVTNINQSTQKASINWNKFSIASNETVNFNQPNKNSITLNRIVGNEKSIINGALNANGQVWLINSNGILFGKYASINTAGLLASVKNISDANFNSGNYTFTGGSTESIINLGSIEITNEGYVALVGKTVSNEGSIKAVKGNIQLVGADEFEINLNGNSLVNLKVKKGVLDALVENKGVISNKGGEIYLTTNAVDELLKGVVNNEGIIEANSFEDMNGHVELFAHGGEVKVDGTLKAEGGFIETSGEYFDIKNSAVIKAKEWLIDPTDITIESTGSSNVAGSSINATYLEGILNGGTGVTLSATNNIYVNEDISWTNALFTLTATNDININAVMNASGTASLAFNGNVLVGFNDAEASGFKGRVDLTIPTISINGDTYTVINSLGTEGSTTGNDLQGMNGNLSGNYVLGANIDASSTSSWNASEGFDPIGINSSTDFKGKFDGLGHTVDDLTVNRPSKTAVGLFAYIEDAKVQNIGLNSVNVTGNVSVGGLVGNINYSSISNSYVTGNVTGSHSVGGIAGNSQDLTISNSHTNVAVSGSGNSIGGLLGVDWGYLTITNSYTKGDISAQDNSNNVGGLVANVGNSAIITDSYASGNVISGKNSSYVGGLLGYIASATISNSYATGNISALDNSYGVGGLVGWNYDGTVNNSYATGNVSGGSGSDRIGGLLGYDWVSEVVNSYATGNVSGDDYVGGLIGYSQANNIKNSYSSGSITGNTNVGGFIGYATAILENNFFLQENTGINKNLNAIGSNNSATGITSKTSTELQNVVTFNDTTTTGLDIAWSIEEDSTVLKGTPFLTMNGSTPIWKIGTKVAVVTPEPTIPDSTPTPTKQKEDIKNIVTPISNTIVTTVTKPIIKKPVLFKAQPTIKTDNFVLVSKPIVGEKTKKISHSEAKNLQNTQETRIPIGRNSVIELVDSGVSLPSGVEQEFYVVEDNRI